jgi:transcription elongation factor GreA
MTTTTHPSSHEIILTRDGYERLREELHTLVTIERAEIAERLREARQDGGDLIDNPDLIGALEDQEMLERRIATLGPRIASARIVNEPPRDGTIGIGSYVRLRDIDNGRTAEYDLVGSIEADPAERRLSADSPVGRALVGQRTGDVVEVQAPRGRMRFRVLGAETAVDQRGSPAVAA